MEVAIVPLFQSTFGVEEVKTIDDPLHNNVLPELLITGAVGAVPNETASVFEFPETPQALEAVT